MKKLLLLILILCALPVQAESMRPPAYRLGLTNTPENAYKEEQAKPVNLVKKDTSIPDIAELTYADLSIKEMSKEISAELALDSEFITGDLAMLWQGAASQSDTINFALYKLANPDKDKPDEKSVKNVLKNIASMSTLAGAMTGDPILATGSIIGGNIFGIMSQDTKALNYKYTKVTDADMIVLVRKIEDLQQKTVNIYFDYMSARKKLDMITQIAAMRKRNYDSAQKSSREVIVVADAYYRTALDMQVKARSDFMAKRAALEQFVGNETFTQFEELCSTRTK
jgi:hypothetical protein